MSAREKERNGFFSSIHYKVGTIAAVPALLLCAMLLLMLLLDIFIPPMKNGQYVVFPAAARIISLVSILCMAACFGDELETDSLHVDLKDILTVHDPDSQFESVRMKEHGNVIPVNIAILFIIKFKFKKFFKCAPVFFAPP